MDSLLDKKIKEIEEYIFLSGKYERESDAFPKKEIVKKNNFNATLNEIDYYYFIERGDQHYFISRQLFYRHIGEYSFFCAHQSIECYLKGFLKLLNQTPPNSHKLMDLLRLCKTPSNPKDHSFLFSKNIETIIKYFEPFYELARYPIQNVKPKDGKYGYGIPDTIYMLDLFIFKMKELIPSPDGRWNIFKNGLRDLDSCQRLFPDFYDVFKTDNINFMEL